MSDPYDIVPSLSRESLVALIEKQKDDIEKLRAALKPFAEISGWYDVEPDSQPAWDTDYQPTVGDLRAAAAALKETE